MSVQHPATASLHQHPRNGVDEVSIRESRGRELVSQPLDHIHEGLIPNADLTGLLFLHYLRDRQ